MKTKLTRMFAMLLAVLMILSCTACADAPETPKDSDSLKPSKSSSALEKKAEDSFMAVVNAENVEAAAHYMETDTPEQLQDKLDFCKKHNFRVEMDYIGEVEDKDIFKCKIILADDSILDSPFVFGTELNDRYVFCEKEAFLTEMKNELLCHTCNASGKITSAGTACAICSGTGQQYYPNAYYNGWLWIGQYQACSGCAGAGYFNQRTQTCSICHGVGLILN